MEFETFFDTYINQEIEQTAPEAINIFSQKIPKEISDKYAIPDALIDFIGHWSHYKNFDEIEKLNEALKVHNPEAYQEVRDFIDEALITYYCFTNNTEKAILHLKNLAMNETCDHPVFVESMEQALYYGYTETSDLLIETLYKTIVEEDGMFVNAGQILAMHKLNIELEKTHLAEKPDWKAFSSKMAQFKIDISPEIRDIINKGFEIEPADVKTGLLNVYPKKDKMAQLLPLKILFMKYMYPKGCSFATSGYLWEGLVEYWYSKNAKNWVGYFSFKEKSFPKFIDQQGGMMKQHQPALLLWGSMHAMEFLKSLELFGQDYIETQKKAVDKAKEKFRTEQQADLWEYSFLFNWEPSDETLKKEQEADKELFKESYNLEPEPFNKDNMGQETDFFNDFMDTLSELTAEDDLLLDDDEEDDGKEKIYETDPFAINNSYAPVEEVRKEHNFRRNDRVTAKYNDGKIKNNVKFKTIENDYEKGLCQVEPYK